MARPVKKVVEKSQNAKPEPAKPEPEIVETDFSTLPEYVTVIGTEKAKYMQTGLEYPKTHRSIAINLIINGDATLKK